MPYFQLHYTSCERGLSGQSGFQFCAITPGVRREITREIERLTVYEPPRSLAARNAPTASDKYPINLIYTFSQQFGTAIIARIVYLGVDFSNRSGNYFVHALVSDGPAKNGAKNSSPLLPIELWEAPFWVASQGNEATLPMLPDSPPLGPVTPPDVSALPGRPDEAAVARLLTAAGQAMAGGKQLLLVDADTTSVCRWIAAICYLLGPDLGPRLTFATYSHDARRCPTHVIGTVQAAGPFRADVIAHTWPFNFAQQSVPELEPSASALLLTRIGVTACADVWKMVGALTSETLTSETLTADQLTTLDESFEVLASAALLLDHDLADAELDAAIRWLAGHADDCAARYYRAAVYAVLRHPLTHLSAACQAALIKLALAVGTQASQEPLALASDVECALVEAMLAQLGRNEPIGDIVPLQTPGGRIRAADACSSMLATVGADQALSLLRWMSAARTDASEETVWHVGHDIIADTVLGGQVPAELPSVAPSWPALRRGILAKLATRPDRGRPAVLSDSLAGLFQSEDFSAYPAVHDDWLVAAVRQGTISPVEACRQTIRLARDLGRPAGLDPSVMVRLWSGRDWAIPEATEVLTTLPPEEIANPLTRSQCRRILNEAAATGYSGEWMTFVTTLSAVPQLIEGDRRLAVARNLTEAIQLLRQAARRTELEPALRRLTQLYAVGNAAVCEMLDWQMPPLMLRHPRPGDLLPNCPEPLFLNYCGYLSEILALEPHDISLAAWIFLTMKALEHHRSGKYRDIIDQAVLGPALPHWSRQEVNDIADEIERLVTREGPMFKLWLGAYKRPWLFPPRRSGPGT